VGRADLDFEGLNLSVDVVDASVRGSWFVEEIEKDDDNDESRGERIEHRRGLKLQGKLQSL
jgi:hypothetical protein